MLTRDALLWTLFAALMGFVVGGSVVWSSQPPTSAPHHNIAINQKAASKRGAESAKPQSLWVPIDSVGLYTLVLCVFTGILASVSIFQGAMLIRSDKTARIAAESAEQSANAAVIVEQPNLFVGIPRLAAHPQFRPDGNRMPHIHFDIVNVGRTPAIVRWITHHVYAEARDFSGSIFNGSEVLVPKGTKDMMFRNMFPIGTAFERINSLYFWIEITYFDVFGFVHVSGFTYFFYPDVGNPRFTAIAGAQYNYHRVEKIPEGQWRPRISFPAPDIWAPPVRTPRQS